MRNLGVISDQDLSSDSHIKQVSAFFHLRNIVKIRNILSQGDAEKLLHASVTSGLDYCSHSSAAIGPACWGSSHDAPLHVHVTSLFLMSVSLKCPEMTFVVIL